MVQAARPTPDTVQVALAGILLAKNARFSTVAGVQPCTPSTKLNCMGSPGTSPFLAIPRTVSIWPSSKHSYSGLMPFSIIRLPKARMVGIVLSKISSPKLQVPQSRVAISGNSSVGCRRSSGLMPVAPPVEGIMMTSGSSLRMASMTTLKRSRPWVGVPSSSRTWMCRIAAPASYADLASRTISSTV